MVILGGGFAGAYCAQKLTKRAQRLGIDVVLIDRNDHFVFTPLLVEAGTGSLEPRHAIVPIRDFVHGGRFRMAEVRDVDVRERIVRYQVVGADDVDELAGDHLVIALGSVTRLPENVPGLRERGFEIKSLADAIVLRDRAIQMLELADATAEEEVRREILRFVVVGGNYTGVEIAGELDEFLHAASRRFPNVRPRECSMTLIELTDRILNTVDRDLSEFARRHLERRRIDARLETTVTEIHPRSVTLRSGETLPTRTVIWAAGIENNPLIARMDVPVDDRGYILCASDLRVRVFEDLWAIGDCAVNRNPDGELQPPTAQHAVRQGAFLAKNIARVLAGRPPKPCRLRNLGSLSALGCRSGVAKVLGVKLSGFPAWFLWRSVYLCKMPRLARRLRVALDWSVNLLFSRDYVQLGVHRSGTQRRER